MQDHARIYEMAELLKQKYTTALEEKAKQADKLATAEEDKLELAHALFEQRLLLTQHDEIQDKR